MEQIPEYYGKGARLKESATQALIDSAYEHDCEDADILLPWLHYADLAHAKMLAEEDIIPNDSAKVLIAGLLEQQQISFEKFPIRKELGDIYNSKDAHLKGLIGKQSGWLHTGRARREAVNIAYILQVKNSLLELSEAMLQLANTFIEVAKEHKDTLYFLTKLICNMPTQQPWLIIFLHILKDCLEI